MTDTPPASDTAELPAARPAWKRPAVIGGGVAAVAVLIGGGAFAFTQLSGGGTQPADVLPDSAIAYARIDLDPSADQKVAMLRLVRKFPDLAKELGIKDPDQDVRRLIVDEATQDCDIDFEKDVEPWLGSRVGIGAIGTNGTPDPVFALQVEDEKKARSGLKLLEKCGDEAGSGIAFLDGYALVAETQAIADRTKKDATKAPLADNEKFTDAMSDLGDPGLASVWVDTESLLEVPEVKQEIPAELLSTIGKGSAAATLRAESDAMELTVSSDGLPKGGDTEPIDISSLPGTTAAAIGIRVPEKQVLEQWKVVDDQLASEGLDPQKEIESFEADTGLRVPEDLATLLSGGLTLVVGERNLESIPTLEGPPDPSMFDIGLRIGDPDGEDLAERLITFVRDNIGLELSSTQTEGGTVIATSAEAFKAEGATLADSGAFEKVVGDDAQQVTYVDVAKIVKALAASGPPPEVADVLEQLKPLGSVGLTFTQDGDAGSGSLKVSFKE